MEHYKTLSLAGQIAWLEAECRRTSQLFTHGKVDDEGQLWPRPIPVSERLPGEGPNADKPTHVLAYEFDGNDGEWYDMHFAEGRFWCNYFDRKRNDWVTHWLPLPPKPE